MAVIDVTDANFAEEVLNADLPVLVDYWADWCQPCKQVAPIIEELSRSFEGRVKFVKLDTNANPITPANHFVRGLPTLHIFVDGDVVQSFQGSKPKTVLSRALDDVAA